MPRIMVNSKSNIVLHPRNSISAIKTLFTYPPAVYNNNFIIIATNNNAHYGHRKSEYEHEADTLNVIEADGQ